MTIIRPKTLEPSLRGELLNEISEFVNALPDSPSGSVMRKTIFKKLRPLKRDPVTKQRAIDSFRETEVACRVTNNRIRQSLAKNKFFADSQILHLAARKIDSILGHFSINEMLDRGRFGPGSTYSCRGKDVSRARKFGLTDVTPEFEKLARGLLAEYPLWANALTDADLPVCPLLSVVPGARFSAVPKDQTIDRGIFAEPTINSWFQQGLGRMIRIRLLEKCGVDLDDQSINQNLARIGSLTDDLATIDLSSASNLISRKVVEFLLPEEWYYWLDHTRSRRVKIQDEWVELECFSSQGNGFTFDLESLIFYALAWAVTVSEGYNPFWVNTFGDDIVIPSGCYETLQSLFSDLGFKINLDKSYARGPFRESCGKDYHLGEDVRGIYLKDFRTDLDLMKFHNRMYGWANRTGFKWSEFRKKILARLTHIKARVPPQLGDVGITSSFDEAHPSVSRDCWEALGYQALLPVFMTRERNDRFLLLDRLQGSEFQMNTVHLRQDPIGYRYAKVWCLQETGGS